MFSATIVFGLAHYRNGGISIFLLKLCSLLRIGVSFQEFLYNHFNLLVEAMFSATQTAPGCLL